MRPAAVVSRHLRGDGTEEFPGRLYLTNRRLILDGGEPLEVELGQIEELALAGERLLVTLRDATGLVDRRFAAAASPGPDRRRDLLRAPLA